MNTAQAREAYFSILPEYFSYLILYTFEKAPWLKARRNERAKTDNIKDPEKIETAWTAWTQDSVPGEIRIYEYLI